MPWLIFDVRQKMNASDTLHIAEIPFEGGGVRFRYARRMSADEAHWIRHGRFVAYFESGGVKSEGEYVDGKEGGLWRDYHANGQLAAEGCYEAGKEEGMWRFFDSSGNEEKSVRYRAGTAL
jgi:antitoxin component YwqK of YwqJK toxin-antitoxin module